MTGKDLLLVVLVAGAAGAAGGLVSNLTGPAPAEPASDLAARLDRIESALARAADDQKAAREAAAKLSDRVTSLQMDVGALRESAAATADDPPSGEGEAAAGPARPCRARVVRGRAIDGTPFVGGPIQLGGPGGELKIEGSPVIEFAPQLNEEMAARMRAATQGMRLRMLPEADRWKKAQDEVHLTDAQVDAIKGAITRRDAAMKDAMQVETTTDAGDTKLTFRRVDPAKAAAAQEDYQKSVTDTLDADQEKLWKDKGYDHAFGGGGGGGAIVVTAQSFELGGATKPDGK